MKKWMALGVASALALMLFVSCGSKAVTTGEKSIYKLAEEGKGPEVDRAIRQGFDVNRPDEKGQTLLHHAVIGSQAQVIQNLLEDHRANPRIKDKEGKLPIDYAEPNSPVAKVFQDSAGS